MPPGGDHGRTTGGGGGDLKVMVPRGDMLDMKWLLQDKGVGKSEGCTVSNLPHRRTSKEENKLYCLIDSKHSSSSYMGSTCDIDDTRKEPTCFQSRLLITIN